MTGEPRVLVSTGRCAEHFQAPLGEANFTRCGRSNGQIHLKRMALPAALEAGHSPCRGQGCADRLDALLEQEGLALADGGQLCSICRARPADGETRSSDKPICLECGDNSDYRVLLTDGGQQVRHRARHDSCAGCGGPVLQTTQVEPSQRQNHPCGCVVGLDGGEQ